MFDVRCSLFDVFRHLFFPNFSTDFLSSRYFSTAVSIVSPSTAASHHLRSERTPAAGPSGCAMIPPPARYNKSIVRVRRYVSGACPPHCPDDTTGRIEKPPGIGFMHASIERTTESSDSQNLFAMPFT